MKKLLLLLFLIPNLVMGESYLCIPEASGGVINEDNKYRGTKINDDDKIIFRKNKESGIWEASVFGEKDYGIYPCKVHGLRGEKNEYNELRCGKYPESFGEYMFNKAYMRYRFINPNGWLPFNRGEIDGEKLKNPIPSITVGKCSEI